MNKYQAEKDTQIGLLTKQLTMKVHTSARPKQAALTVSSFPQPQLRLTSQHQPVPPSRHQPRPSSLSQPGPSSLSSKPGSSSQQQPRQSSQPPPSPEPAQGSTAVRPKSILRSIKQMRKNKLGGTGKTIVMVEEVTRINKAV